MTTPTFTDPPTTPTRAMSDAAFTAASNAWVAWMATFYSEIKAAITWIASSLTSIAASELSASNSAATATAASDAALNVSTYVATSSTSLSLSNAALAVTLVESGRTFANGQRVILERVSDPSVRGSGLVSLANMGAKTMTITVDSSPPAAGPFTDWLIKLAAFDFLPAATVAQVRAGSSQSTTVTPANLMSSTAFQSLAYGATVNWDWASGWNADLTFAGNPTIAAPTNLHDGLGCALALIQGSGGNTATWNSIFDWGADGAPTLSTGAGKVDFAFGVYKSSTGKIHMSFRRAA